MRSWMRRLALLGGLSLPTVVAATWTTLPAVRAAWAVQAFSPLQLSEADWEDADQILKLRRDVQRHFLQYNVYLPIEDILTPSVAENGRGELPSLMQKACGQARLYVWIPMRLRLPLVGDKVYEWCWKPRMTQAQA